MLSYGKVKYQNRSAIIILFQITATTMSKPDSKLCKSECKIIKKFKNKITFSEKFNEQQGWCQYQHINLEKMEKRKPFQLTNLQKVKTQYGNRLLAGLDYTWKLYLPERYTNTFTAREMRKIELQNVYLVNRGPIGKTFDLEVVGEEKAKVNEAERQGANSSSSDRNSISLTINL